MKTTFLLGTALLLAFSSIGQKLSDVANLSFTDIPFASSINQPSIQWRVQRIDFYTNAILKTKDSSWKIFPNVGYTYNRFQYRSTEPLFPLPAELRLHTFRVGANILKEFNKRWGLLIAANLGISTELGRGTTQQPLFPNVLLALTRSFGQNFHLQLGVALNNQVANNAILPYVGYVYASPNKKFSSELQFPNFHVTYHVGGWIELGLSAAFDPVIHSVIPIRFQQHADASFHRMQIGSLGPAIGIKLLPQVWLNVRGGRTVIREHELWNQGKTNLLSTNLNSTNDWFVRFVLSFRLPEKN